MSYPTIYEMKVHDIEEQILILMNNLKWTSWTRFWNELESEKSGRKCCARTMTFLDLKSFW